MRFKLVKQHDENDCGAASFSMILKYYGLNITLATARKLVGTDRQGTNIQGILEGAEKVGLAADGLEGSYSELMESIRDEEIQFPFIARVLTEERYEHYVVVFQEDKDFFIVGDPGGYHIEKYRKSDFEKRWLGDIITFSPTDGFKSGNYRHGLLLQYFSFIKENKLSCFWMLVFSLFIAIVNITGSFLFEAIINQISNTVNGNVEFLGISFQNVFVLGLVAILFYLFACIVFVARTRVLTRLSKKISVSMSTDLFRHLVSCKPCFLNVMHNAEYLARFYDANEIKNVVSITFLSFIMDLILAIGSLIALFVISAKLSFVILGIAVLYIFVICIFIPILRKRKYNYLKKEGHVLIDLKGSIDGVNTLKSYHMENYTINKIHKDYEELENERMKTDISISVESSIMSFLSFLSSILILTLGMVLCNKALMNVGMLISFYYLSLYFFSPIEHLMELEPIIESSISAADRLNDIYELETENYSTGIDFPDKIESIEFKNVAFRYGTRKMIFEDLSLNVEGNKKTAIIGQSGCGKSSLAKILLRYYPIMDGDVLINGVSIYEYNIDSLRKAICYVSENTELFADSIAENILMGDESITVEELLEASKMAHAHEFIAEFSTSYDTVLEENGRNLSGGQRQRLSIARALAHKPKLLILDEATANLDYVTEQGIINALQSLNITCIVIAHRLKTISNCDSVYVLGENTCEHYNSYEELIEKSPIYKEATK